MANEKLQNFLRWALIIVFIVFVVYFMVSYIKQIRRKKAEREEFINSIKKESSFNSTLRREEQSEVETATAPRPTGNDVYDTMVMRG